MQLRGYIAADPNRSRTDPTGSDPEAEAVVDWDKGAIADHLFATLRGRDNLVFTNARAHVETYTDLLSRRSAQANVPNEFLPHHGNLSKEVREHVEDRLKASDTPTTAVCTSTLEMGIDIGSADSVAQVGAPLGVSVLRQRLGRSGRRGQPAVLRLYVSEPELTEHTPPADALRSELMQTIAMVDLLLERWYEPPDVGRLHLSTLLQQILSVIAQLGGADAAPLFDALCAHGPFRTVDQETFVALLRAMGEADLVTQDAEGLLLHGSVGEKLVNHFSFYTAFTTEDEYRLVTGGRTLGSLPVEYPISTGSLLIFSGRRWRVLAVETQQRVIDLAPARGGRPPAFPGLGAEVADEVRRRMLWWYESDAVAVYLDRTAQRLLDEGRAAFRRLSLDRQPIVSWGRDTVSAALARRQDHEHPRGRASGAPARGRPGRRGADGPAYQSHRPVGAPQPPRRRTGTRPAGARRHGCEPGGGQARPVPQRPSAHRVVCRAQPRRSRCLVDPASAGAGSPPAVTQRLTPARDLGDWTPAL